MAEFGDALATGTDLVGAAESAVAQALEPLSGRRPDLFCVYVSGSREVANLHAVDEAGLTAMKLADAPVAIGCSAPGVIGAGHGVEGEGAVAAFAAVLPGVEIRPFHVQARRLGDSVLLRGLPDREVDDSAAVLLADPAGFPVVAFVEHCNDALAGLPLIGGLASGTGDGGRLFLDGRVVDGAVGVVLGGGADAGVTARTVVSQGCRPIGPPMTVTKAEQNVLLEVAGVPAFKKLQEIVAALPLDEQQLAIRGLHLGVAINEYAETHERGDFLIRGVLGADERIGALVVGDVVDVGTTVRFQVRDPAAADEDLAELLSALGTEPGDGVLLFSCTGRGRAMFPDSNHDVAAVRRVLHPQAVAGFFAAGEIGPVGGRNHVHGFTASLLTIGRRARPFE
jgi:small ligand-binding sensory domain FIST